MFLFLLVKSKKLSCNLQLSFFWYLFRYRICNDNIIS